jgi:hypothetical protein
MSIDVGGCRVNRICMVVCIESRFKVQDYAFASITRLLPPTRSACDDGGLG